MLFAYVAPTAAEVAVSPSPPPLTLTPPAYAPPPTIARLRGWLGTGVPLFFGRIDGSRPLADHVDWAIPVLIGLGYERARFIYGGYADFAPGMAHHGEPECEQSACSFIQVKMGFDVRYLFGGVGRPWLGVGAGFEVFQSTLARGSDMNATYTGFELAHASLGYDFRIGRNHLLTPFIGASVGTYLWWSKLVKATDEDDGGLIRDRALHGGIVLGVRLEELLLIGTATP